MALERIYWDTSCFISYLSGTHPDEVERAEICESVLQEARNDEFQICTSAWTIVETLRPKELYKAPPLPSWASLLDRKDKQGNLEFPKATRQLEDLWTYFHKNALPSRLLSDEQSLKVRRMFDWPWIRLVQVTPTVASRAAEIARSHNMRPGDSIHVATALSQNCSKIHRWDRDYSRTDQLIPSLEPSRSSLQSSLKLSS